VNGALPTEREMQKLLKQIHRQNPGMPAYIESVSRDLPDLSRALYPRSGRNRNNNGRGGRAAAAAEADTRSRAKRRETPPTSRAFSSPKERVIKETPVSSPITLHPRRNERAKSWTPPTFRAYFSPKESVNMEKPVSFPIRRKYARLHLRRRENKVVNVLKIPTRQHAVSSFPRCALFKFCIFERARRERETETHTHTHTHTERERLKRKKNRERAEHR